MTIADLNQLQYLKKFIKHERDRLETMRESLDVKSHGLSDMPKSHTASDRIGDKIPEIVDEVRKLEENLARYEEMERKLSDYIQSVKSVKVKMYMTLRYIDGYSWDDVADYVDNGNGKVTADNVRMATTNYLKRESHTM